MKTRTIDAKTIDTSRVEPYKNGNCEVAIQSAYEKLTKGMENLEAEPAVDSLMQGAYILKIGLDNLLNKFYDAAEDKQLEVMNDRAGNYKDASQIAASALESGNLDAFDQALQESIEKSILCKESASKLKHIKNRGVEEYDSNKEMSSYIKKLDYLVDRTFNGTKQIRG